MGSILERIKTTGTEIRNELTEKIKEGTDAASQSEQLGALFREMPQELDDDVREAVKESRDAVEGDATKFLQSEVVDKVEDIGKKTQELGGHNPRLHADEVLIALAISATTNPAAALAMKQVDKLRGCEAHSTVMVTAVDSGIYRKLGINLTQEPVYQSKKLFHR